MYYKHEFAETDDRISRNLEEFKKESGRVLGETISKQVPHKSHTHANGTKIHTLEVIVYPVDKWDEFLTKMRDLLPEDLRKPVKKLLDEMDPSPEEFYGDLLPKT